MIFPGKVSRIRKNYKIPWEWKVSKGFCCFSCFLICSVFKGYCRFPVSGHFPYLNDFAFSPVSRHFWTFGMMSDQVPSWAERSEAREVHPSKLCPADDPPRRPKAGLSLVSVKFWAFVLLLGQRSDGSARMWGVSKVLSTKIICMNSLPFVENFEVVFNELRIWIYNERDHLFLLSLHHKNSLL